MKLMIAGSRSITDFDLAPYIPNGVDTIISGGAKGIDALAERLKKRLVGQDEAVYAVARAIKRMIERYGEIDTSYLQSRANEFSSESVASKAIGIYEKLVK